MLPAAVDVDNPVQDPDVYDRVYRRFRTYIFRMVSLCGIPSHEVEDSVSSIMVRMLAQDGMTKFEGEMDDDRVRRFLASYFRLAARAELTRVLTHQSRTEMIPDNFDYSLSTCVPQDRFEEILNCVEGDARRFVEVCGEHPHYRAARQSLTDEGWSSVRIRRAVVETRSRVRELLCLPS